MNERYGVGVALLSCSCGAGAAVATRFLIGSADPLTLAAIRFGGGFFCILPLALVSGARWPDRSDWPAVAALGFMFYGLFFVAYNIALAYTTVARGTLALSTLPLMTMLAAALLGIEPLSHRKSLGVLVAMFGVCVALASSLEHAPADAWRGDLIMIGATLCMAFYSVWSRRFINRSSALGFLAAGMGAGGLTLMLASLVSGGAGSILAFGWHAWLAAAYLALGGGALAFFLWIHALQHASPTRVTNTMTINPLVASLLAALLLSEPVSLNLLVGLAAVFAGIWVATTEGASQTRAS